jgi:hypothetical protein
VEEGTWKVRRVDNIWALCGTMHEANGRRQIMMNHEYHASALSVLCHSRGPNTAAMSSKIQQLSKPRFCAFAFPGQVGRSLSIEFGTIQHNMEERSSRSRPIATTE